MNPRIFAGVFVSRMLNDKYIIGLTGGFASGKTTVVELLKKSGFAVIDADEVAREVVEPGEKAYELIVKQWGQTILKSDKRIDRQKLALIVFTDDEKRKILERILHPIIIKNIWDRAKNDVQDRVIIMAPLLFETGMEEKCDMVIVVTAPENVRLERAVNRDKVDPIQAKARMESQMKDSEKVSRADIVIDTDCDMMELEKRVEATVREIGKRIAETRGIE